MSQKTVGITRLSVRQHGLLCEALRRQTRFNLHDLKKPLTEAWTGLGLATDYKPAVDAGLMTCATKLNPGYMTWWKLTEPGAKIVQAWIDEGYSYEDIEAGKYPPLALPEV
mgnify:FL=1